MARILVIDDEADMRLLLEYSLISAGHQVITAIEGEDGVGQCRGQRVDMVITDLFMPNQEGLETIAELRKEFPALPIIAISGDVSAKAVLAVAQRIGAAATLRKPFSPDQLLATVSRVLRETLATTSARSE